MCQACVRVQRNNSPINKVTSLRECNLAIQNAHAFELFLLLYLYANASYEFSTRFEII